MNLLPYRIRLGGQTQGDIVDVTTAETDTTKVLKPNGTGGVVWGTASGGGSGLCDHQHTHDRFVAAGGTPETFTLSFIPMWAEGVQVSVDGSMADPNDVTIGGSDVSVDTVASDVVIVWYARACSPAGGAVADSDPSVDGYTWYDAGTSWPPTLGTWAALTEYPAGSFVLDSNGHTQVRYPIYPGKSGGSEPTWDTGGSFTADADGYWFDLGISPDYGALTTTWAATTYIGTGSSDEITFVEPTVPTGHKYIGAATTGLLTGSTEPVWPTTAGNETITSPGGGYGQPGVVTSRPYVSSSETLTLNGTPISVGSDWDEDDPTQGSFIIYITNGPGDVIGVVYTPA